MKFRSKGLRGTPSVKMLRAGRTAIASSTQKGLRPRPTSIMAKLTATAERATIRIPARGRAGVGPGSAGTGSGSAAADAIDEGVYTLQVQLVLHALARLKLFPGRS
jgi:hypothetical protein